MKILDIITESFLYPPGQAPDTVIDLRDPNYRYGYYKTYKTNQNVLDKNSKQITRKYWIKKPIEHLVITRDKRIIIYYYGNDANTKPWKEVLDLCDRNIDTDLINNTQGIIATKNGYLIDVSVDFGQWAGDRNQYSKDVIEICKSLLDMGFAKEETPIWIGRWASGKGQLVGTVGKIIMKNQSPDRIVLYHGTDTLRMPNIMRHGLQAVDVGNQVWSKTTINKKEAPAHRNESVYLTASKEQAEYYAKKAVNVDRKRYADVLKYDPNYFDYVQKSILADIEKYENRVKNNDSPDGSYYKELIRKEKEKLKRLEMIKGFTGNLKPVILKIVIYKKDFDKLMADDDFLVRNKDHLPTDWQASLSKFSQIAYKGVIPPNKIRIA